ncbi:unnamed protein product [Clavelina lepadiformis]|uniref:C2H2-type domain-containing protein n=1 Tax=Clavelina lepadiformis TaxID=159417 RepID=A0ABP0G421_CLALP
MEFHPSGLPVAIILKEFSDLILQELKSMRQEMNLKFAKIQENMKENGDIGICIQEVYSEKASVSRHLMPTKEEPLQDWEISRFDTGDKIAPTIKRIVPRSEIERNVTIKDEGFDFENLTDKKSLVKFHASQLDKCTSSDKRNTNKVMQSPINVENDKNKHFCCSVCGKPFKRKASLKAHLRSRAGEIE